MGGLAVSGNFRPPITAIVVPTYAWARVVARQRRIPERNWIHVRSWRQIGGRKPGKIIVESKQDHPLTSDQIEALAYMEHMGWEQV
jgi:hypothetical protein